MTTVVYRLQKLEFKEIRFTNNGMAIVSFNAINAETEKLLSAQEIIVPTTLLFFRSRKTEDSFKAYLVIKDFEFELPKADYDTIMKYFEGCLWF